jgi:nucleotidyltransferase substrate binding protein (TIGR01987 family)
METIEGKLADARRALSTMEAILAEAYSVIVRDAAIQRFEYTFEAVWKFTKEYLKHREGIVCNSPKACFRELLSVGVLSDDETAAFLHMTDRRNDTSHTYKETIAEALYRESRQFLAMMQMLLRKLESNLQN